MKKNTENVENQLMDEELVQTENQKKKPKKKTIIIIVIIVISVLALAYAIGSGAKKFSQNMQDQMNEMMGGEDGTYTVDRQDVEQEITTSGSVIGIEKISYTSPVTAKVEDICVEVGQTVSKGDILLTYDSSKLGDDLAKVKIQAQSDRAAGNESYEAANEAAGKASAARKKVKELKADIKKLEKEIAALSKKVSAYEEQMASTQTQQDQDSSEEEADGEKASGENAVDQKAYKKAVSDLEKKNAELAEKQQSLAEQESIVAANEDVKVSESTKAQISAANQLSDMNVNDAQESLDAAEAGITASGSGIVESIDIVKGAYANETQTLMTIIDSDKIGVQFSISKDDLGSISKGQKARVVISGNEYEGTVDFVSRVASSDMQMSSGTSQSTGGTITGRIVLDEPDENIYIGVSAKVYIFVGKSEQTLVIPYEALNTDIDGDFVYIVNKENLIERKDVTLGIYSDEYYEVLEGLEEGDRVICNVTSDMKQGDEYVGNAINGTVVAE